MGNIKNKETSAGVRQLEIQKLDTVAAADRRDFLHWSLWASAGTAVGFLGLRGENSINLANEYAQGDLKDDLAKKQVLDRMVFSLAKGGFVGTFLGSILAGISGSFYVGNRLSRRKLLLPLAKSAK